jgi:molybdopterin converting factor small subunit
MVTVCIPSLMRDLTAGQAQVVVTGRTLGEVVDALEQAYPGVKARLLKNGQLDPALHALIGNRVAQFGLREPVQENSEVRFLPAIAGG